MSFSGILTIRRRLLAGFCYVVLVGWSSTAFVGADETKPETDTAAAQDGDKPPVDATHPLYRPLELAYKSREALKDLKDYEAIFTKLEFIDRRKKETTMKIKFRTEPFSVYLLFMDLNKGREVIFVQGKNNNQLLVHESGLGSIAGTLSLDPKSPRAMADNRYPVTMIGMRNMLGRIIAQWETEGKFGETTVLYYNEAKLENVPCPMIQTEHPQPRDQFKFKRTRLYLDQETNYPVRVEQFAFPGKNDKEPPQVEVYNYSQIKANLGLSDKDFDHTNPSYAFPK